MTEVGPGAILGELALLQEGRRTATLRAVTPCRVAVVPKNQIDRQALEEVAKDRVGRMPHHGTPVGFHKVADARSLITVHAGNISDPTITQDFLCLPHARGQEPGGRSPACWSCYLIDT